jgi:hypothetical protein
MIEIRGGLCKLEFSPTDAEAGERQHALVEFVRPQPLRIEDTVRVSLGARDGYLRELSGRPQLVETKRSTEGRQYFYRLSGPVASSRSTS